MTEVSNTFLDAIDITKDSGESITNMEWQNIKDNTTSILSNFNDDKQKEIFLRELTNLEDHFKNNATEVYNLSKSELYELKQIFESNKKLNTEEIGVTFNISNSSSLKENSDIFKEAGLDLENQFNGYDKYIKQYLGNINNTILDKVYKSIGIRVMDTSSLVIDLKKEHPDNFEEYRWVINEKIQDNLLYITNELLPSLAFYSKNIEKINSYNNGYDNQDKHGKLYAMGGVDMKLLEKKISEIEELMNSELDDKGNFVEGNYIQRKTGAYTQNIFDKSDEQDKRLLVGIPDVDGIDVLTDEDKALEGDIMIKYIAYVSTMMIPYAGAVTSVPSDLTDAFTNHEGTINSMKIAGLIPEEYQMSKHWYDTAFGVVGLVGTAFGVQAVSKGGKFAKAFAKLHSLGIKGSEVIKRLGEYEVIFKEKLLGSDIKLNTTEKSQELIGNKNLTKKQKTRFTELYTGERKVGLKEDFFEKGVLKLNDKSGLATKTDSELTTYFLTLIKNNPSIKEVDISGITDKAIKSKLNHIIGLNHPLLNISRLMPGQNVVDITFLGVKDLNDNISKEFVDLFNDKFKAEIAKNFYSHIKEPRHGRLVRSDYKHITLSLPHEKDAVKILFGKGGNRKDFIKKIFASISDSELDKSMENASKALSRTEIEQKLLVQFDFGMGVSRVPGKKGDVVSNEVKLESFYKTEISSRVKPKGDNIELTTYNFETTKQFSLNAFKDEAEIVKQFENATFKFDDVDYDIIRKMPNGEKVINPYLLRYIRKGKDIGNDNLELLVKSYLDNINNAFDFISPVIKSKSNDVFEEINKIGESITNGKIKVSTFEKNYKGTYTAKAIENIAEGKEGMRIFVDIVDMGIMNLEDFRGLAKKVATGEIKSGNISELLDAGLSVTKKFQDFVKEIEKIPGSKVSLGGDEVFIFIEGKTGDETAGIIKSITKKLDNNGLRGRVSYCFDEKTKGIYDNLDSLTKINKIVEKKIEEIIVGGKLLSTIPNNLTLSIDKKLIGTKEGDYDKFLEKFEKSIDYVKLLESIQSKKVGNIEIGTFDNIIISIQKNGDSEFILKIK